MDDLADLARRVIDDHTYMALGTADASGMPWVSPVYFTVADYTNFFWVSAPDRQHSRNLATRPEVSIAIFDSRCAVGTAEAVYIRALATEVPAEELADAAAIYNDNPNARMVFTVDDLQAPALFRLYRARAVEHSVLIRGGDPKYGKGADSRMTVTL